MCCILFSSAALAEGLLPQLEDVYGVGIPSFSYIVSRPADKTEQMPDGTTVLTYSQVLDKDYYAYGEFLANTDCVFQDYTVEGDSITCTVGRKGKNFLFTYDTKIHQAVMTLPSGVFVDMNVVSIKESSIVDFGQYEQDNDLENGPEPIKWIVLKIENGKALLLSKYALDRIKYAEEKNSSLNWENSYLRHWLNEDFINSAFNLDQQNAVQLTGAVPDRIFLLSAKELESNGWWDNRKCQATPYSINHGTYTDNSGYCTWRLRPSSDDTAFVVNRSGVIERLYYTNVISKVNVRPAFWMDLKTYAYLNSDLAAEAASNTAATPTKNPTPKPTSKPAPTPKPTTDPSAYNSYAAIYVAIIKGTLKNPNSLQVHDIRVMEYKKDTYIVIDFSAMNGFGGYTRETYSFKFEMGRISLSGNSSDYDQYEKHKNDFSLITRLDVDDVLKFVK